MLKRPFSSACQTYQTHLSGENEELGYARMVECANLSVQLLRQSMCPKTRHEHATGIQCWDRPPLCCTAVTCVPDVVLATGLRKIGSLSISDAILEALLRQEGERASNNGPAATPAQINWSFLTATGTAFPCAAHGGYAAAWPNLC